MVGKRSKSLTEALRDPSFKKRSASLTSVDDLLFSALRKLLLDLFLVGELSAPLSILLAKI